MATATTRWTDAFLDRLRTEGDAGADLVFEKIQTDGEGRWITDLFRSMDSNDARPPGATFPELEPFFRRGERLPADVDLQRVHRGEDVFIRYPYDAALALLAKSLPEGYQAPNLALILQLSGDLQRYTYRRLLATLQTVVNVSSCHGFGPTGQAVITAQKLRLLHSGIRAVIRRDLPDYEPRYGVPVNQEDMLGTIMGFSLLVIEGWRHLGVPLTDADAEDYLYLWLTFARLMGCHPPLEPDSRAYVPDDLADARAFYAAYQRRHYVAASQNPAGVALAKANLRMLRHLVPWFLRPLGFGFLPRVLMHELMGQEACDRLAIPPVPGHPLMRWAFKVLGRLLVNVECAGPGHEGRFGLLLFQHLIDRDYDGEVTFTVPDKLADLHRMIFLPGRSPPAS